MSQTKDSTATPYDVNVMALDAALRLAIDAINNDSRRTPYGHHQWNRARAIRALEKALRDA